MDKAFDIINYDIHGQKIKEELLNSWLSENSSNTKKVEKIELYVYGDYSGIDTQHPSGIYLNDGITIKISDRDILKTINKINSNNLSQYEIISFKPEADEYIHTEENIPIEKCLLSIFAIKSGITVSNADNAYLLACELVNYIESVGRGRDTAFSYGSFFDEGEYGSKLFNLILDEKRYEYVDKLIFDNLHRDQLSWVIARVFIKRLRSTINEEEKSIVKKLVTSAEPLSDYWKEELQKRYPKVV